MPQSSSNRETRTITLSLSVAVMIIGATLGAITTSVALANWIGTDQQRLVEVYDAMVEQRKLNAQVTKAIEMLTERTVNLGDDVKRHDTTLRSTQEQLSRVREAIARLEGSDTHREVN